MATARVDRRLAAILAADVVGYARLMERDEAGTFDRLRAHRRHIMPLIAEHHGRVVKLMGDGALCEFGSVVDAVACAVVIQREMAEREAAVPEDQRLRFRLGINLGDVLVEDDDIYGDGVNVAARLEGLAEPGGICISGKVREEIATKLELALAPMGLQHVKNIAGPIEVWRVLLDGPGPAVRLTAPARPVRARRAIAATLAIALVVGSGITAWHWIWNTGGPDGPSTSTRPSIAVMPFTNLDGSTPHDEFASGLTDDLITDLSKVSGLLVIARNSVFAYGAGLRDNRQVAKELGVSFLVDGSVRRADGRVRINAQLVDGLTGRQIWADRYDRPDADVFAVQDDVIDRIIAALAVRLTDAERARITRLPTESLEAYDYYLRAEQKVYNSEWASVSDAVDLYQRAIALDPRFADAYAGYARALVDTFAFNFTRTQPSVIVRKQAYEAASRALALNPDTPRAFSVLALLQMLDGEHDAALQAASRAVALDPNGAEGYLDLAIVLAYAGQPAEALAAMDTVLRLNPRPPPYVHGYHGFVLYMNRRYGEAVEALLQVDNATQSDFGLETLAMAYARLGRLEEAKAVVAAILERWPNDSIEGLRLVYAYTRPEALAQRLDALRLAGMPEWPYGFVGSPEDRLGGDAIRSLTFGRTWTGQLGDGQPFIQQVNMQGETVYRRPGGLFTGVATVEGDTLCLQLPTFAMGRKACAPVYRNRSGAGAFAYPNTETVLYFSPTP